MYLIPNIVLVGYGRTQTYQIKCLKCETLFFPPKQVKIFCEDCLELPKEKLNKYIKPENESEIEYLGNVVGWEIKGDISLKRSRYNYLKVYKRDEYTCQYCWYNPRTSKEFIALSIDHLIPFIYGGSNSAKNMAVACMDCNRLASSKVFKTFDEKKRYILQRRVDKGYFVDELLIKMYELKKNI